MEEDFERLKLLGAESRLGVVNPNAVVEQATDLVIHSPANAALVELAGQQEPYEAVSDLLEAALNYEGIAIADSADAGRIIAKALCRSIVRGETTPIDGARNIWWKVVRRVPDLESELGHFVGLASEWEDDVIHRDQYDADICRAAELFESR